MLIVWLWGGYKKGCQKAYPLEQGLRRDDTDGAIVCVDSQKAYPLEQGLRPESISVTILELICQKAYPLEQGLRLWLKPSFGEKKGVRKLIH